MLGLADKNTSERLETACLQAMRVGDASYKIVEGIRAAGTDRQATPATAVGDGGAAAHLRGPAALLTLVIEEVAS